MARRRFQSGSVFKRGKNWVLRYREDIRNSDGSIGRRHRSVVIGYVVSKKEAKRQADMLLREINNRDRQPQSAMTFTDFWHRYFVPEVLDKRKFSTRQVYGYLANKHLLPFFGTCRLCELSRADVQDFVNLKHREKYAPKTLRHLRNLLSKVFSVAVFRELIAKSPVRNLDLPPMEKRRQARVLTLKEISDLLQAADDQLRAVFMLGLLPGLRIGEILGLKVSDLDLENRFFNVQRNIYRGHIQNTPKTPAGDRWVPIASVLLSILQHWIMVRPHRSDWLFPSDAGTAQYERNLLRREVWPLCDRLGIARFGWHSLRHTFSTYGGNNGVPLPVLQYLLGHASAETTMIYTHPLAEAQRRAVEQMATILFPSVPTLGEGADGGKVLIQ
jgi:integrase